MVEAKVEAKAEAKAEAKVESKTGDHWRDLQGPLRVLVRGARTGAGSIV